MHRLLIEYEALKKKYHRDILKFHPDKCKNTKDHEKFLQIQQEWSDIKKSLQDSLPNATCEVINIKELNEKDSHLFSCQCGAQVSLLSSDIDLISCETCSRIFFVKR